GDPDGPGGGPNQNPLPTTDVPSDVQAGCGAVPQPNGAGSVAGTENAECVVPFGFGALSSGSVVAIPATSSSCAAVVPAGRSVAVWKPSIANWMVAPVGTDSVLGKKSLNAQLWPLGTADGMSAVIVGGGPDASAWAGPMSGTARDN